MKGTDSQLFSIAILLQSLGCESKSRLISSHVQVKILLMAEVWSKVARKSKRNEISYPDQNTASK